MKKKKKGRHFPSTTRSAVSPKTKTITLLQEVPVKYIRQAEQYAIPTIKEFQIPPAIACFLLAQYAQILATGDEHITLESAMSITTKVLDLWQDGVYTPSSDYPYTLEETLQDQQDPLGVTQDYGDSFLPFQATAYEPLRGKQCISAGLVRHPETQLWQIWLIIDGPCVQLAAYRDVCKAQQGLEEIIALVRKRGIPHAIQALCWQLKEQSDGVPKQIPFDMMQHLLEHIDRYTVRL